MTESHQMSMMTDRKDSLTTAQEVNDVAIVGAGPGGLACAIEAKRHNLN